MLKKMLGRIIWIPLAVVAVIFLVSNRQPVAVSLDPFSDQGGFLTTPALPMWLWLVAMLFLGLALGVAGSWSSNAPARRKTRTLHQEVKTLKQQLSSYHQTDESIETLPALTSVAKEED